MLVVEPPGVALSAHVYLLDRFNFRYCIVRHIVVTLDHPRLCIPDKCHILSIKSEALMKQVEAGV